VKTILLKTSARAEDLGNAQSKAILESCRGCALNRLTYSVSHGVNCLIPRYNPD
jgi:hypothetical protein